MRRALQFLSFTLLVVLAVSLSPSRNSKSAVVRAQGQNFKQWGIYWSAERGFHSTLEMKNNRVREEITANISLYFSNGTEVPLPAVTLGPRQTVIFDLNEIVHSLPRSAGAGNSREGTIEVEYVGPNASSIMGSVSVINSQKKIAWNFFLYPERPGLAAVPLRGLFWFPNSRSEGFVALQNISEQPLFVTPTFQVHGTRHAAQSFALAPEQGTKLEIRQALAQAGVPRATEGGIEFTYSGEPDALRAHGVLFDGDGFSAEVDFLRFDSFNEDLDFNYRAPRVAVGAADPVLGLPSGTTFRPNLLLHNFNAYRMDIQLALGVRTGNGSREFKKTISLDPGETQVLEPHRAVLAQLPDDLHWVSLELSYHGRHNGLGMMLVSTTAGERHSIRSVLNWVEATAREGWIWKANQEHNTLLGIFNSDVEDARVAISLDFYEGDVRYSFDLPERTIPKRSADLLNIKRIIDARDPDKDGDVIPASVTFGGYRVRKIAPTTGGNLTTEALLFDRAGSPFLSIYNTGCCQDTPYIEPSVITGDAGGVEQFFIYAENTCTGVPEDLTSAPVTFKNYPVGSESVAYGQVGGFMNLESPGQTYVTAISKHPQPWNFVCRDTFEESLPCLVTVKPQIASISPGRGLIGSTTAVTIDGSFGTSPTVQAGSGITVNITSASNTQIQANFVVAANSPAGNHSVTVTVGGQTSNSVNFFVQVPTSVAVISTTVQGGAVCPLGSAGWSRTIVLELRDQSNSPIKVAGIVMADNITIGSPNSCGASNSQTGQFATDANGRWPDTYFICSTACATGSCQTNATQTWTANAIALSQSVSVVYTCNSITVNGG